MMQGDQYFIPLSLKTVDGAYLTADDMKDLEFSIGEVTKMLSKGEVISDGNTFFVKLNQEDTFQLKGKVRMQARLLFEDNTVVGVNLGENMVDVSLSKEVLK
jgi:hypothetical protein